jgi:low temperature requirement protein LtrA
MTARAIDEPHRASSQLELLFDLTFVVAIAAVTAQFAHHISDGRAFPDSSRSCRSSFRCGGRG